MLDLMGVHGSNQLLSSVRLAHRTAWYVCLPMWLHCTSDRPTMRVHKRIGLHDCKSSRSKEPWLTAAPPQESWFTHPWYTRTRPGNEQLNKPSAALTTSADCLREPSLPVLHLEPSVKRSITLSRPLMQSEKGKEGTF